MKRFTETTKWDDPWFIRLPVSHKLLWLYICDRCDASGVIDFCPELASVQIGDSFVPESLDYFGSRLTKLTSGKWQIVKFLTFQYGNVDANCPAHKPVIRLIYSNGLKYPINNLSNGVSDTLKEKDKDKEKDKSTEKEGECEGVSEAERIYQAYPLKKEKPQALAAIRIAIRQYGAAFLLERTLAYAKSRNGDTSFMPYPQKWFKREGFNDDPSTWKETKRTQSKPKEPEPMGAAYRVWDSSGKPT